MIYTKSNKLLPIYKHQTTLTLNNTSPQTQNHRLQSSGMTAKNCGHRHEGYRHLARHLFFCLLGVVIIVLWVVLLVFLILHPAKPSFVLRDATVYEFNTTSFPTTLLTTTIQVTLSTRNPNTRIGIYYQKLDAYVSYRDQRITMPVLLPESYQGHKEIVEWSPFLRGVLVPVSPSLVMYHLHVSCPALLVFKGRDNDITGNDITIQPSMKIQVTQHCYVDV